MSECGSCKICNFYIYSVEFRGDLASQTMYILAGRTIAIAIGVIAESLSRSPFSVERPAPPGQWKFKLKCTISIAVGKNQNPDQDCHDPYCAYAFQRRWLRYIVSYGILSHTPILFALHLYCTALPCMALHCMINYSII